MPIKNYTTKISTFQTVGEIQSILAAHGAKRVMLDYTDNGSVAAITFSLDCGGTVQAFRLEARTAGVVSAMSKEKLKCDADQADRIAWRNIKDWIAAQVALVEIEQASMDELFLPMLLGNDDQTLYSAYRKGVPLLKGGYGENGG